jgi:arylsulfatase A-like enzyme
LADLRANGRGVARFGATIRPPMAGLRPAVLLVLAIALGGCAAAPTPERPNIILILADDLGYGDLRCTGHPYAWTPAIDKLAGEGTLFLNFYQLGATCVPTRTALMTGLFPATFQKYPSEFDFGGAVTLTELLKQNGYITGHIGKWHIGRVHEPGTYGIDSVRVMEPSQLNPEGRDADIVFAAIDFIRANKGRPFYLNIWCTSTHARVRPPESFVERFEHVVVRRSDFPNPDMQRHFNVYESLGGDLDRGMRNYLAEVLQLDLQVRRVLTAIDELGLRENTIVAFTSDNGPAECVVDTAPGPGHTVLIENMLGSAGPFRDRKHSFYDGGIHQPLIIRWPGHVTEGRVDSASVIAGVDWLPSLCAIAGVEIEADAFDGEDVSDILLGADRERKKEVLWKGFDPAARPVIRRGIWKLHAPRDRAPELYNLAKDPGERRNVAREHPDIAKDLRATVLRWDSTLPTSYEMLPGVYRRG